MTKSKKVNLPIVEIVWRDHCWIENKDLRSIKRATPYIWNEIGYVLAEDSKRFIICQHISQGFDGKRNNIQYENATIILKTDVIKVSALTKAKK